MTRLLSDRRRDPRGPLPVTPGSLHRLALELFVRAGLPPTDARTCAEAVVVDARAVGGVRASRTVERWLADLAAGTVSATAAAVLADADLAWASVDGRGVLPPVAVRAGVEQALARGRSAGLAYVGLDLAEDWSGLARFAAERVLRAGSLGLVLRRDPHLAVAPPAGAGPLRRRRFAICVPATDRPGLLLDTGDAGVPVPTAAPPDPTGGADRRAADLYAEALVAVAAGSALAGRLRHHAAAGDGPGLWADLVRTALGWGHRSGAYQGHRVALLVLDPSLIPGVAECASTVRSDAAPAPDTLLWPDPRAARSWDALARRWDIDTADHVGEP